jgi:uncharacterized membrane protein YgdD (TMEM256/DUF423 family)
MNWVIGLAGLSGAMAVAAGAFGAHGASGKAVEWLQTGGTYQLVHAAAAVAVVAVLREGGRGPALTMLVGALIFAATLYAMALGAPRWFGAITPIGGAAMIAGWLWVAWVGMRS